MGLFGKSKKEKEEEEEWDAIELAANEIVKHNSSSVKPLSKLRKKKSKKSKTNRKLKTCGCK